MKDSECFQKNVKRWGLFSPDASKKVEQTDCSHSSFSTNPNGEPNLVVDVKGQKCFVHSEENALEEAKQWLEANHIRKTQVLFVYGIGLGYVYEAARDWLRQHESHTLICIEDNLEVIHRFFETERATEFLHDKQAGLEYVAPGSDLTHFARMLTPSFCLLDSRIGALPFNASHFPEQYVNIHSELSFWLNVHRGIEGEFMQFSRLFFSNLYHNLLTLPTSYRANGLNDKFKGVPAIICGAGPSLDKNLPLLETLADRALIFAGATALNAVNSRGFLPHFGVGIDPNPAQATRLIANKAFDIPFLYRNRINTKALQAVHGDHLYVNGASGYPIMEWIETELDIPGIAVSEGCNVVNFSLALAQAMGCNPIILVGVDLAYSDKRSYHSGVTSHPTHIFKDDFTTKTPSDELVTRNDIYGNPVLTQWKWITESTWFGQFTLSKPGLLLINATEGGLGMPGILNKPLAEVEEHLLKFQFDLHVQLHGEIQNNAMPPEVTVDRIEQLLQEIRDSLKNCQVICREVVKDMTAQVKDPVDVPEELGEETAYRYILKGYYESLNSLARWRVKQLDCNETEPDSEIQAKKRNIHRECYEFVIQAAEVNSNIIQYVLDEQKEKRAASAKKDSSAESRTVFALGEEYAYGPDGFTLIDPEMNLSFQEKYSTHLYANGNGRMQLFYPSGNVKFEQFLEEGKLHGPVTFFSEAGKILARSWYVKGVQQGKAAFYYASGALHSVKRHRDGVMDGQQQFYYSNGIIKSTMDYSKGKLHGDVVLYYADGCKKRELHFADNLRQGKETMWDATGLPVFEVQYHDDKPAGTAKLWHEDGQLAQEIAYDESSRPTIIKRWDQNGMLISDEKSSKLDFFDQVTTKAELLTQSLDTVYEQLHAIAPMLNYSTPSKYGSADQILKELEAMKAAMAHLHSISRDLQFESGIQGDNPEEAIWKTPTAQRDMQSKLELMVDHLSAELKKIQDIVQKMVADRK